MRDARFSSSRTSIDAHTQTKIDAFLHQVVLSRSGFPLNIWSLGVENIAGTCRVRFHNFCPRNIFVELNIFAISSEFDFFGNKAKMRRFSQKCMKEGKMRDFLYDCGMVDTYAMGNRHVIIWVRVPRIVVMIEVDYFFMT